MTVLVQSLWSRHIVARMAEVETWERWDARMREMAEEVYTGEEKNKQQQLSDIWLPRGGVDKKITDQWSKDARSRG